MAFTRTLFQPECKAVSSKSSTCQSVITKIYTFFFSSLVYWELWEKYYDIDENTRFGVKMPLALLFISFMCLSQLLNLCYLFLWFKNLYILTRYLPLNLQSDVGCIKGDDVHMSVWHLHYSWWKPCSLIRHEINILYTEVIFNQYKVKDSYFHLHDQ